MTHFGIICPAGNSHLNPMTTLGNQLLRRGHQVTVFNFLDAKAITLASGLEFQSLAEDEFPAGSLAENHAQMGQLSGLTALGYTIKLVTQVSDLLLSQAPAIIKKADVEALLVDQVSVVSWKELSVSKVRSAIVKVLTQESYKQRAIEMQGVIGRSGGVKRAADIIEQAVLTGKPVLASKI